LPLPPPSPARRPGLPTRDRRHGPRRQEHDLQVGYIAVTPVWRPSYRLVLDEHGANPPGLGIVQNLSGEDWTNVSLSLIAEAPLAFDASLRDGPSSRRGRP